MMSYYKQVVMFIALVPIFGCGDSSQLNRMSELKHYSSGSGIAFFNHGIYLAGDDMGYLLITDTSFNVFDTIVLSSETGRIPKDRKADLEASSVVWVKKVPHLLLLGSGSVFPFRSKGWYVDLKTRNKTFINLDIFYTRLQANGIKEVNIEGLTSIPGGMLLSNRGNKANPRNYLIFTSPDFWRNQQAAPVKVMKLGVNTDTASFSGVSGLDYSYRSDRLFLTVSTENTYSSFADGTIGKSYLWIIDNISSKRRLAAINPNRIIDLESIDKRFKGHKIESVCLLSETKSVYTLALVADDDTGTSILFTLKLDKRNS